MVCAVFFRDGTILVVRCQPHRCAERLALDEIKERGLDKNGIISFQIRKVSVKDGSIYPGRTLPCSTCTQALLNHGFHTVSAVRDGVDPAEIDLAAHEAEAYTRPATLKEDDTLSRATTPTFGDPPPDDLAL